MWELPVLPSLDCPQLLLERALRGSLHVGIERRVHLEPLLVQLPPELRVELLAHPFDEIGSDLATAGRPLVSQLQRVGAREARLGVAHHAGAAHELDHRVAARNGALRIASRIVALGPLRQRGQCGGFREVELARRFAEILLRGRLHAVRTVAEVDLIQVELENSVLGILPLDLAGDFGLFELAHECLLPSDRLGEEVAGQLHRDRREPLRVLPRDDVARRCAEHPRPVDPVVRKEPLVLGDDERVADGHRDLAECQQRPPLESELSQEAAIGGIQLRRLPRLIRVEDIDCRTAAAVADK